jgi:hypothetical protein
LPQVVFERVALAGAGDWRAVPVMLAAQYLADASGTLRAQQPAVNMATTHLMFLRAQLSYDLRVISNPLNASVDLFNIAMIEFN